jgi:sugar phosphate isomerase/epimerase
MRVTLGINNCFAAKRWPRPDEWSEIVRTELRLGVVQHSLDLTDLAGDINQEATAIAEACADRSITVHSVFTGLAAYSTNLMLAPTEDERGRAFALWSDAVRFASAVGAPSVGGHAGSLSRHDADTPERRDLLWRELGERLIRLSELACQSGLDALLVENMACNREPCRMSDFDTLLRPADRDHARIALCLDVGHQCAPGVGGDDANPYAWLRKMGPQTAVVHLQQSDAQADHHWPFTRECNERGRIHAPAVLDALVAAGTDDATLVLEVIPPFEADDEDVLRDLRESVIYWQHAIHDFQQARRPGAQTRE